MPAEVPILQGVSRAATCFFGLRRLMSDPHIRVDFSAARTTTQTSVLDFYEPTAQVWDDDLNELRVRLLQALVFMLVVTAVGTMGFVIIDPDAGWVRAFFMTAITLTTVGYGQEVELRIVTSVSHTAPTAAD